MKMFDAYDFVKIMNRECYYKNLWYYIKTNMIRAPLEALLALYITEAFLIFTKNFINKPLFQSSIVVYMIFLPLGIAASVCFVYSAVATILVGLWACITSQSMKSKLLIMNYIYVHNSFSKLMIFIHLIGSVCYIVTTRFVASKFADNINNKSDINVIIFTGCLFGILYNTYGYLSDMRLDLSKIFKKLETVQISKEPYIYNIKLKYYIYFVVFQGIIVLVVLCCSIFIIYNFDYKLLENEEIEGLIAYSSFATLYCAIIVLYFKQMYSLFFSKKYNESIIFPKFEDFK